MNISAIAPSSMTHGASKGKGTEKLWEPKSHEVFCGTVSLRNDYNGSERESFYEVPPLEN